MLLLENLEDKFGDLLDWRGSIFTEVGGKNCGTAKLESGGDVAVDVGDGCPGIVLLVVFVPDKKL